jgi:HK97 family phage major capsid protein
MPRGYSIRGDVVWPARLIQPSRPPSLVYLDMNHYINLAKVKVGTAPRAASWVVEGDVISETDPTLGELVVTPMGLKALTTVSNELIADSAANAEAAGVVGDGLVRSFARAIDSAFFSTATSNGPDGLGSIDY